ncbi:MAG: hypothetical protein IKN78_11445 [Bacteroidales bacterium]|nr:hypothetical protein [Bacteroidales bacterium]
MKKMLVLVSAVLLLAGISTSCSKGCHCYYKTDVAHMVPLFEDESMGKSECQAKQDEMNAEEGIDIVRCK